MTINDNVVVTVTKICLLTDQFLINLYVKIMLTSDLKQIFTHTKLHSIAKML